MVKVRAWVTRNTELSMSQFSGASLCGCHWVLFIAGVLLCWFEAGGSCCWFCAQAALDISSPGSCHCFKGKWYFNELNTSLGYIIQSNP